MRNVRSSVIEVEPDTSIVVVMYIVVRNYGIDGEKQFATTGATARIRAASGPSTVGVLAQTIPADLVVTDYLIYSASIKGSLSIHRQAVILVGGIVGHADRVTAAAAFTIVRSDIISCPAVLVRTDSVVLVCIPAAKRASVYISQHCIILASGVILNGEIFPRLISVDDTRSASAQGGSANSIRCTSVHAVDYRLPSAPTPAPDLHGVISGIHPALDYILP